jgi:hypothetical protein
VALAFGLFESFQQATPGLLLGLHPVVDALQAVERVGRSGLLFGV